MQKLVKKMKTLISKVLLCPDLYLSKTSCLWSGGTFTPCWYKSFPWLHYDLEKCVVLCATCASKEKKRNLALSLKKEDAFLSTGSLNWKKSLEKFRKRKSSFCHLGASTVSVIWEIHENIEEMFCNILSQEKFENRQILLKILENLRFLCRQGLTLRGNEKEDNCCILQKLIAE